MSFGTALLYTLIPTSIIATIQLIITIIIIKHKENKIKKYLITSLIIFSIGLLTFIILSAMFNSSTYNVIIFDCIGFISVSQILVSIILFFIGITMLLSKKRKQKKYLYESNIINVKNAENELTKENKIKKEYQYCEYCGCKIRDEDIKCPNCSATIKN